MFVKSSSIDSSSTGKGRRIDQYYERLPGAGKPGKVAVIAAMGKLLVAVWNVSIHRRPFVPVFVRQ